jgi:ABC-type arginine transport system permease subunit
MAIWYILWLFGMFVGFFGIYLVYCTKKNLATLFSLTREANLQQDKTKSKLFFNICAGILYLAISHKSIFLHKVTFKLQLPM